MKSTFIILRGIAALAAVVALAALGNHLYWKDAWGVRTFVAQQFPANVEKQNQIDRRFDGAWLRYAICGANCGVVNRDHIKISIKTNSYIMMVSDLPFGF